MFNILPIDLPLSDNRITAVSSSGWLKWILDRNLPINFKDMLPYLLFSEEIIPNVLILWKQDEKFNPIHALSKQDLVYHLFPIGNYKLYKVIGNAEPLEPTEVRG